MHSEDPLRRLGDLARRLPFAPEDFDAVNRLFCRWVERHEHRDLETLQLWVYYHVHRYVLLRLAPGTSGEARGDHIVEMMFDRASAFDKVNEPERFTHWISVVCKRTYLNGLRRLHRPSELDVDDLAASEDHSELLVTELDRDHLRHALARAVAALPEYLQTPARMRLLEGRSYDEIAAATGHENSTLRTYTSKALQHLHKDADLRTFMQELDLIPP